MAKRDKDNGQVHKGHGRQDQTAETDESTDGLSEEERERLKGVSDEADGLLDEIDEVLEENAEDFVRGFIQKGGQ